MKSRIYLFLFGMFILTTKVFSQEISPTFYGQNHWLEEGDEIGRPGYINLLWPQVKASGVKLVRIGGNHYLTLPERHRLDRMVDSIQAIGAEPIIQVPGTFNANQTKELVSYYNKSKRIPVKFWCIGNEPLHSQHNLSVEQVHAYILEIAPAIRAVDKNAKIFVFDEAIMIDSIYAEFCGGKRDVTGKDKNGNWLIDGFTFHNYPNGSDFDRDDVIFSGPVKIERQMKSLVKMMEAANLKHGRTGINKLLWGMTEVHVTYANPDREIAGYGNPSFLGGQFIAQIYGLGLKYKAFTVAPWCISEVDHIQTDFGYLGLPDEFHPRSSYYHTQIMSEYITGCFVESQTNQGYVKTISSMDNGQLSLLIMNQDNVNNYDFEIVSDEELLSLKPLIIKMSLKDKISYTSHIPNQTSMLLVFSKSGKLIKRITYGLSDNLVYGKPKIELL